MKEENLLRKTGRANFRKYPNKYCALIRCSIGNKVTNALYNLSITLFTAHVPFVLSVDTYPHTSSGKTRSNHGGDSWNPYSNIVYVFLRSICCGIESVDSARPAVHI